ncbi:hypothetical protein HDU92_001614 [Lobulomyces angularis]|nr:hypothetical protein HDU92_001614 [Lobulomyces angularis]
MVYGTGIKKTEARAGTQVLSKTNSLIKQFEQIDITDENLNLLKNNSKSQLIKLTRYGNRIPSLQLHDQVIKVNPAILIPTEQERHLYKNSSKIKHDYGPSIAPLTSKFDLEKKKNTVPVILTWDQGGESVNVTGSFNKWKQKIKLKKSYHDFSTIVDVEPGTHQLKFIVDSEWKCSDNLPVTTDSNGNLINIIDTEIKDGLENCGSEEVDINFESDIGYNNEIPIYLLKYQDEFKSSADKNELNCAITDYTKNEGILFPNEPPPILPAYCDKVLLDAGSESKFGKVFFLLLVSLNMLIENGRFSEVASPTYCYFKPSVRVLYKKWSNGISLFMVMLNFTIKS